MMVVVDTAWEAYANNMQPRIVVENETAYLVVPLTGSKIALPCSAVKTLAADIAVALVADEWSRR